MLHPLNNNTELLFFSCYFLNICFFCYAGILVYSVFFLLLLVLVSFYFCWVLYLAYPNLLGKKALIVVVSFANYLLWSMFILLMESILCIAGSINIDDYNVENSWRSHAIQ
jgi:hypothetical protein